MTTPNSPHQPMQACSPATATSLLVNPSPCHPSNLTPETSSDCFIDHQKASPNVTDAQHCPAHSYPVDLTPITRDLQNTFLTAYDSEEILVKHHEQNVAPESSILCMPNQEKESTNAIDPHSVTFWTSCTRCRMLFEYQEIFRNQELLCHCCKIPFLAIETPAPSTDVCSARSLSLHDSQTSKFGASGDSRNVLVSSKKNTQSSTVVQSHKRRHKRKVSIATGSELVKKRLVHVQRCVNTDERSEASAGRGSGLKRTVGNLDENVVGNEDSDCFIDHQKALPYVTGAQHCPAQSYPVNLTPITRDLQKTSLTAYDSEDNLVKHHEQNVAPDSSILCMPNHEKESANAINPHCVTFWTSCIRCRTLYEYQEIFLNKKLMCQHCKMPFMAIEMSAPDANVCRARSLSLQNLQTTKFGASRDSRSMPASPKGNAQSSSVGQSHKRGHKMEVDIATGLTGANPVKKRQADGQKGININKGNQVTSGRSSGCKRSLGSLGGNSGGNRVSTKTDSPRRVKELSRVDIRSMLMGKAKNEIILKLVE